jgi:hypothetical protein
MLSNFITDAEFKNAEYMHIKNKICSHGFDINKFLEKEAEKKPIKKDETPKIKKVETSYYDAIIKKKEETPKICKY